MTSLRGRIILLLLTGAVLGAPAPAAASTLSPALGLRIDGLSLIHI